MSGITFAYGIATIFTLFIGIIGVALAVLVIYLIILFIKLSNRGIKALDIYINEKTQSNK